MVSASVGEVAALAAMIAAQAVTVSRFTAEGDEGNAITITGLNNKYITEVLLNRYELEPVDEFPENDQYSYNVSGTFTFNQDLEAGDKLKITHRPLI